MGEREKQEEGEEEGEEIHRETMFVVQVYKFDQGSWFDENLKLFDSRMIKIYSRVKVQEKRNIMFTKLLYF